MGFIMNERIAQTVVGTGSKVIDSIKKTNLGMWQNYTFGWGRHHKFFHIFPHYRLMERTIGVSINEDIWA